MLSVVRKALGEIDLGAVEELEANPPAIEDRALGDIRQIARSVRKSSAHIEAERKLDAAKDRLAAISDEVRALVAATRDSNAADTERQLIALDKEALALKATMPPLREALAEAYVAHAEAVRRALAPVISEAAYEAYLAVETLKAKLSILGIVSTELLTQRGDPIFFPQFDLEMLSLRMQRLSGK